MRLHQANTIRAGEGQADRRGAESIGEAASRTKVVTVDRGPRGGFIACTHPRPAQTGAVHGGWTRTRSSSDPYSSRAFP